MTSSNYVIEARHLTKSYGKNQVLKGIDLQVERGTMLALLGPNGAGKTTIVRILSTLLGFDGGTVLVDGGNVIAEGTPSALKSKVGNDRLELTFRDAESFQRAVAELGDDIIDADPKEFSAIVIIKDTNSDVKRALDVLAAAGIAVQSLAVHKPTLDDVFLSLTGKQKLAQAVEVK